MEKKWRDLKGHADIHIQRIHPTNSYDVLVFGAKIVLHAGDTKPLNFQLLPATIFLEQKNMMQNLWALFNMWLLCAED